MSYQKYRFLDLTIFSVLYFIFEFIIQKACIDWFPDEVFSVSLLLPIILIVMMRWDYFAIPLLVIFGAYFVLITCRPGTFTQYAIYIIGNIGLIIPIYAIKKIGKEKICQKFIFSLIYVVCSYLILECFRAIAAMIFAGVGVQIFVQYIFTDSLNLVFSMLIIIIARKAKGLFEDQKTYLLKVYKENQNAENVDN